MKFTGLKGLSESEGLKAKKSEGLVTPGEKLGVIEEFQPGRGTYTKNGVIYAESIGRVSIDLEKRMISVSPEVRVHVPAKGDIILGEVQQVQDKIATIKIFKVKGRIN